MADSELEKFADKMGAAAKQLSDGIQKIMKILEKMEKDKLNQLAKADAELGKMLKEAGFEASKENIDLFKKHNENLKAAEAKVESVDANLKEARNQRSDIIEKKEGLEAQKLDNNAQQVKLMAKKDPSPEDELALEKLAAEETDLIANIKAADEEIDSLGEKIDGLEQEKLDAGVKLDGLQNGEGLEGLKVDSLKQSLKVFKENSVGAKMMENNALSTEAKVGYGAELPAPGDGTANIAQGFKMPGGNT